MATIRNPLISIKPSPMPGYGIGVWQDGSEQLAPMAKLQQAYDATRAMPDQRLAQLGPNPLSMNPNEQFQSTEATQNLPPPPPPTAQADAQAAAITANNVIDPITGQPLSRAQLLYAPVRVPGRPGYNARAADASAFPVRQKYTEETAGGKYLDEQALLKQQELERQAAEQRVRIGNIQAQNAAAVADENTMRAQEHMKMLQSQQAADESDWQQKYDATVQEGKDLAAQKIDGNRVWNNMSTWGKVLFVIGGGLSAGGGGKGAVETLMDLQDRDTAEQVRALAAKQGEVQNALSDMRSRWGTVRGGRAGLQLAQLEAMKASTQSMVAQLGTQVAAEEGDYMMKAFEAKAVEQMRIAKQESMGQRATQQVSVFKNDIAATPSYSRDPTFEEVMGRNKLLLENDALNAKLGLDKASAAKLLAEANKLQSEAQGGAAVGFSPEMGRYNARLKEYQQDVSNLSELKRITDDILKQSKVTVDPTTGLVVDADVPGTGTPQRIAQLIQDHSWLGALAGPTAAIGVGQYWLLSQMMGWDGDKAAQMISTDAGKSVRANAKELIAIRLKEVSGAAVTEKEREEWSKILATGIDKSDKEFAQAIVTVNKRIGQRLREAKAGAPESIWRRFESNLVRNQQETDAAANAIGEEPLE